MGEGVGEGQEVGREVGRARIEHTSRENSVFSGRGCCFSLLSFFFLGGGDEDGEGGGKEGRERGGEETNMSWVILRGRGTTNEEERKRGLPTVELFDNLRGLFCWGV